MHKLIAAVLMLLIMVAPAFSQAAGTENDAHVALDQIAEQL